MTNPDSRTPRLLIPALRRFYESVEPLSWLLIRITAGLMLMPHGWPKVEAGIAATAATALAKRGIQPAEPLEAVLIVIALRGGGPYSLDRKLGSEL